MSIDDRFETLLTRMESSDIAARNQLKGCSEDEIVAFEQKYNLRLPYSYRSYLALMGHSAGNLFAYDHLQCRYDDVVKWREGLTALLIEAVEDNMTEEEYAQSRETGVDPGFKLPPNYLIILSRLMDYFLCIECQGADDTPTFYFNWANGNSNPLILPLWTG